MDPVVKQLLSTAVAELYHQLLVVEERVLEMRGNILEDLAECVWHADRVESGQGLVSSLASAQSPVRMPHSFPDVLLQVSLPDKAFIQLARTKCHLQIVCDTITTTDYHLQLQFPA